MEVKPAPGEEFVRVGGEEEGDDVLAGQLAVAGVVETGKLAAHLWACHLDERSLAGLDNEDLVEVLQGAKEVGVSVGDRAKLKALVRRSSPNHTYFTSPGPRASVPPSPTPQPQHQHQQEQEAAGHGATATPSPTPPEPKRLAVMFNQLAENLLPLRTGVVELIDSVVGQYFTPALSNNSLWPRAVALVIVVKGFGAVFKRRHGGSAFAAFLCGFLIRPRQVAAETTEDDTSPPAQELP